jgi:hypothetical protein
MFSTDNNGVIIELPAASGPAASLNGALIFGIGTQSTNGLNGTKVYTVDASANFVTTYKNQAYNQSFVDSGSNALYFLNSSATGIPVGSDATSFFCRSAAQNLSATNSGANGGASGTVNFSAANTDSLLHNNPGATLLGQVRGPSSLAGFDWGLPFF